MLDDMRVVVVTPAGRKRYLEILFRYIAKLRPVIDEYRLWVNTLNTDDIAYMEQYQKDNSDYVTIQYLPDEYKEQYKKDRNTTIHYFFKDCKDPNTIYVRFDDDIVFIDNIDKFTNYLRFRRDNPQYFLVFGNIINNGVLNHIHQRIGALGVDHGICGYSCLDPLGWENGNFTKYLHYSIFNNIHKLSSFYMNNWLLCHHERVSINVISWLGSEFEKFNGVVDPAEEEFLSIWKPQKDNKMNIIYGGFLCIHYAFWTQREVVDEDKVILLAYNQISNLLTS
jgi:hypothetical protein